MTNFTRYHQLLLSLCTSLVVIIFYHGLITRSKLPEVVSVDVTQITQEWILELTKKNLSEQENSEALNGRIKILNEVLKTEGEKQHWIIVPSQGVFSGAPDVTAFIKEEVVKRTVEKNK